MNRKEWLKTSHKTNQYHKIVKSYLIKWKSDNNLTGIYDIHHRDDTEECRKYNEEHYELWGCNADSTFEYGKYVIFIEHGEHARHHGIGRGHSDETRHKISLAKQGSNHPNYGKHLSESTRKKIGGAQIGEKNHNYGKHPSDETRKKLSESHKGKQFSDEHRRKLSENNVSRRPEVRAKKSEQMQFMKRLYNIYQDGGGLLKWNDFRKAYAQGLITLHDE